MLIDRLLSNSESLLMQEIRNYYCYDYSFEHGTFGDELLQSGRIVLFKMLSNYITDPSQVFQDYNLRKIFFSLLKNEMKENDQKLQFMKSLDDIIIDTDSLTYKDVLGTFKGPLDDNLESIVISNEAEINKIRKIKKILEDGKGKNYFELRKAYANHIAEIYEEVMTGDKDWNSFKNGRESFFAWRPNLQETIRYTVETYIMPYYSCTLEDLPIQGALTLALKKFNIFFLNKSDFNIREYLLIGFPEMRDSPHWHPSRWSRNRYEILSEEEKIKYSKFRRDYLFRYVLGCKMKEDVIAVLDNDELLQTAIRKEKIPHIYKNYNERYVVPFSLVSDLEGEIYNFDPWELKGNLPKEVVLDKDRKVDREEVVLDKDGKVDREKIRRYFQWVKSQRYKIPSSIKNPMTGIPHYNTLVVKSELSPDELRQLADLPTEGWKIGNHASPYTWIDENGTPIIENVMGYFKWLDEEGFIFPKTAMKTNDVPHFTGMYHSTRLSFSSLKKLYYETIKQN